MKRIAWRPNNGWVLLWILEDEVADGDVGGDIHTLRPDEGGTLVRVEGSSHKEGEWLPPPSIIMSDEHFKLIAREAAEVVRLEDLYE